MSVSCQTQTWPRLMRLPRRRSRAREYAGFLIPWRRVISRFAQLRPRCLPKTTAIAANSTAIALALHGEHTPEFRGHHTNTDAPPNEQAGTAVSEQPLVARVIGSLLDK
jgi:hypothetical protein